MIFKTTTSIIGILMLTACANFTAPKVVVQSSPTSYKIPLSEVTFSKIDIRGDPSDIVQCINEAMKTVGFPLGLTIGRPGEGERVYKSTHLQMKNATLRQIIDQMCVQLRISYWDNIRLRELYFYDGESTCFTLVTRAQHKDGTYTRAGPDQFMPPGFASLPFAAAYFDMTIEALARERGLVD